MAAVSRSSPGKGAPRCSPLGNRAKPTPSPDTARKVSRSLVFQPQLLDSTSQDDRCVSYQLLCHNCVNLPQALHHAFI